MIGFVFFMASRGQKMEQGLFQEIENMPELNSQQCPYESSLIESSRVILFDFSDPLPAELEDYPAKLLDIMMDEMQDADRFDRFGIYSLNPFGDTPKSIGQFCVPVTLNQIPDDVRRALWGKDPEEHANLPPRYQPFLGVFERLWENQRELDQFMTESRTQLANQSRSGQGFSRIIENIEEIVGLEFDRSGGPVNIILLSDMLQNSPAYSHYRDAWEFDTYLSRRSRSQPDMERFRFEVYLVQSCSSRSTSDRRTLQRFWEDYFHSADALVTFKLLERFDLDCGESQAAKTTPPPTQSSRSSSRETQPERAPTARPLNPRPLARSAPTENQPRSAPIENQPISPTALPDCPAPKFQSGSSPLYPRGARGDALLRYTIHLDSAGVPESYNLDDAEVSHARSENLFKESAAEYIDSLRFTLRVSDRCKGGQTVRIDVRF